jgi:hypothetical protein
MLPSGRACDLVLAYCAMSHDPRIGRPLTNITGTETGPENWRIRQRNAGSLKVGTYSR